MTVLFVFVSMKFVLGIELCSYDLFFNFNYQKTSAPCLHLIESLHNSNYETRVNIITINITQSLQYTVQVAVIHNGIPTGGGPTQTGPLFAALTILDEFAVKQQLSVNAGHKVMFLPPAEQ